MSTPDQRRAILALSAAAFASAASLRICDPLLPELARDFSVTTGQAAQVVSTFSIAYGLLQLVWGPIGDRYGKCRLVNIVTLACVAGGLMATLAGSFGFLLVARALTGAAAAAIIPMSMAWIGDNIDYRDRQATLARFLSGQMLGVIGGQIVGGFFADTLGWRWAFGFLVLVYLSVGIALYLRRRADPQLDGDPAARRHQPRASFARQVAAIVHIAWARRVLATVFLEGMALFGAVAFIPAYLHLRFGLPLTAAGAILAGFGVGGLIYAFGARRLVSTLGEERLSLAGGAVQCLAFLLLMLGPSWHWGVPAGVLVGLGYYMFHNTLQVHATQMAPEARGTAVSVFASAFFTGQSVGVALAAVIVDNFGIPPLFAISALALPLLAWSFARAVGRRGVGA